MTKATEKDMNQTYAIVVLLLGIVLIILSLALPTADGPQTWLTEWTDWGKDYVALAVAAHAVVKLVDGVNFRLRRV